MLCKNRKIDDTAYISTVRTVTAQIMCLFLSTRFTMNFFSFFFGPKVLKIVKSAAGYVRKRPILSTGECIIILWTLGSS